MSLKDEVIADLTERGTIKDIDAHIVDKYVAACELVDALFADVEERGVMYIDERGIERQNGSVRSLTATMGIVASYAKLLGLTPYGRKLTTGATEKKKPTTATVVSQLRPIERNRPKAK